MDLFRERISKKPKEFLKTVAFLEDQEVFKLEGDKYKRTLDPAQPPAIQDWYQRKNLYLVCNREIDDHFFSGGTAGRPHQRFQGRCSAVSLSVEGLRG